MKIIGRKDRQVLRHLNYIPGTKVFIVINNNLSNIDTKNVDLVINLNLPNPFFYFQRASKTGRGLSNGTVLSYVLEQ
jgi:superfamily II DNA/RNA helicase